LRIHRTESRLVLNDVPGALWLLGLTFTASGTFVLTIPFWAVEWREFGIWARLAVLAIGIGHLAGGLYAASQPAATRTELDRATGVGTQLVRKLWPFGRGSTSRFSVGDVRDVEIVRAKDNDGDPTFQLRLWLSESRVLWVQAQPARGEQRAREHADEVARFLTLERRHR